MVEYLCYIMGYSCFSFINVKNIIMKERLFSVFLLHLGGLFMKIFQKIAGLCLALTLCVGMAAFAACGDGGNTPPASSSTPPASSEPDSSEPAATTGHKFRVLDKDGKPVAGVVIQLCKDSCTFSAATDANGEVSYAGADGEVAYDIHVWSVDPMNNPDGKEFKEFEFEGAEKTPAVAGEDVIVLTLKD